MACVEGAYSHEGGHGCVNQIGAPVPSNPYRAIGICMSCGVWLESRITSPPDATYDRQAWFAFGPIANTDDADRLLGTP